MHRRRSATMSSPIQASAQAVQAWAQSKQASMQTARSSRSKPIWLGVLRNMSLTTGIVIPLAVVVTRWVYPDGLIGKLKCWTLETIKR